MIKALCPFCGENSEEDWFEMRAETNFAVACPGCGCIGPDKLDKNLALEAWNARASFDAKGDSVLRACVKAVLESRVNNTEVNWDAWLKIAKETLGE